MRYALINLRRMIKEKYDFVLTGTQYFKAQRLVSTKQNYKMPMEDIIKNEVSDDGISDELLHREVIQDADLYYLHHYLGSFRNGIIFKG